MITQQAITRSSSKPTHLLVQQRENVLLLNYSRPHMYRLACLCSSHQVLVMRYRPSQNVTDLQVARDLLFDFKNFLNLQEAWQFFSLSITRKNLAHLIIYPFIFYQNLDLHAINKANLTLIQLDLYNFKTKLFYLNCKYACYYVSEQEIYMDCHLL